MYLDAVKEAKETINYDVTDTAEPAKSEAAVFQKWQDFPISKFSHHGTACCEIAREWLFSMDFSQLNGGSVMTGPRWIRQRFNWGPTQWHIHWCEAIQRKELDCGAQAALANEVFLMRGVKSYPVQLVQKYSKDATNQWASRWNGQETSIHWINEDLIYHEGCAVVTGDNEIKIWDASAAWWIHPQQFDGYGSLMAVRIFAPTTAPTQFKWGHRQIAANEWQRIESHQKDLAAA